MSQFINKTRVSIPIAACAILLSASLAYYAGCDNHSTAIIQPQQQNEVTSNHLDPTPQEPEALEDKPKPAPSRIADKTFDDIKFEMESNETYAPSMLTPEIESLEGKRVRIRGYILPTAQKRGIKQFVLVRDNMECCFGPGAALYDCVLITMKPGTSAEFTIRPVAVEGIFELRELHIGRQLMAIYQMQGETVE